MTREEREKAIEIIRKYECNAEHYEACEAIIKASEQESVLDKIKAEIEAQEKWLAKAGYNAYNVDIAFGSIKRALRK